MLALESQSGILLTPESLSLLMLVFPESIKAERNFTLLTEIVLCQANMKHGL